MSDASSFGLPAPAVQAIREVFRQHPAVRQAIVYRSRAMGRHRPGSDIDLCLQGEALALDEQFRIEQELDDLLLPYKIDLSLARSIENPSLIEHIRRAGRPFYGADEQA
jgi:predicted nucleotidyltransferase